MVEELYLDQPMVGASVEYAAGFIHPVHSHDRAQLLFASRGIMATDVPGASFFIPPGRALWIPSNVPHKVACRSAVSLRTLYFTPESVPQSLECKILEISDFLRALILEAVTFSADSRNASREKRISQLIIDEIADMPTAPFKIPLPSDKRLLSICDEIKKTPSSKNTLEEWAVFAGMSKRTLTRSFRMETGMGLSAWCQQARLLEGLSLLESGRAVTDVAYDVGYNSPSAFSAIFRKTFGVSPKTYRSKQV
ncbi:MAG: helix-turn-helix transcriptional regulator [Pseudomonadota bacterium]